MAQRSRHGFVEHQQSFADRSTWSEVEACARAPTVTLSSCRREQLRQDGPGSLSDRHLQHAADELLANAFSSNDADLHSEKIISVDFSRQEASCL
eukprot:scaffold7659_cov34-Phaeocystis_antarctica.AAC.1